jgi:hypothetical protein
MRHREGDEVAIFRAPNSRPSEVLEIATVLHAGPVFIQLHDGRMFATVGGMGLNTVGWITVARGEHWAALERRGVSPATGP